MNINLEEIQNTLQGIYQKNLDFFKEDLPDIYEQIEEFSNKLSSGEVQEKYALEILSEGYFDIVNLENNGFFYGTNTYVDADGRVAYNDFSTESSWNLLRQSSVGNKLVKSEVFQDVLPIVDYINEKVDLDHIQFKEIFKMVFIGTGLGFHINEIYKKLQPKNILIIEPEIEIFRLSMFTVDYTIFNGTNRKLFITLDDNKIAREKKYHEFYAYQDFLNFNIKNYKLLQNHEYIKDELNEFFSLNHPGLFPYKLILDNLHVTLELMKQGKLFLNQSKILENRVLEKENVLLISAGPSLDNYVEWIKKNQSKFMIVCVDVILKKLEKNNIVPDIVVSIDPHELCADYLNIENKSFLNNTAIIFLSQQHEKTLEVVSGLHTYFAQSVPIIDELGYLGSLPNVGTFSLNIALQLGAKKLFLIGSDAAFNQETGDVYSKDSSWKVVDPLTHKANDKNKITIFDTLEVKGNLRDTVKTNRKLFAFKKDYENFLQAVGVEEHEIYNLSDGVYIEGMKPLTQDNLEKRIQNQNDLTKDILDRLAKVSEDIEDFDFDEIVVIVNSILRKINKYKKMTFKNRDDFLQNKLDLMIWILEQTKLGGNSVVSNLFLMFTSLADIYVNFVLNLNQKGLHTKDEINILAQMWMNGLYNLFKDIKKALCV